MPKVSVIVPVYNVEKFIHKCVDSIINQALTDIEIILVDDGSPDNCPAICDTYANLDSRIRVIHKKNGGLSSARNAGMDVASGEYIAFVDSDDFVDTTLYENMYNTAISNNLDIVACGVKTINQDNKISDNKLNLDKNYYNGNLNDEKKKSLFFSYGSVCTKMVKRNIVIDNNIKFPEGLFFEDYYFGALLSTYINSIGVIDTSYYYYYVNENSITRKKDNDYQPQKLEIMKHLTNKLKEIGVYEDYYNEVEYLYSCFCYMNMAKMCVSSYTKPNYKLLFEIRKKIKKLYPSYKKNKYFIKMVSKKDKIMIELCDVSPHLYVVVYKVHSFLKNKR